MKTLTARILACSLGVFVLVATLCVDDATIASHSQYVRRLIVELKNDAMKPHSAYKLMDVCLDESYVNPAVPDCTADKLITFTNDPNPTGTQFRYKDDGPESMQGVFWLSTLEGTDSIMSFAATPDVGGGISTGSLQEDKQGYHYRLRDYGDRVWAFATTDYHKQNTSYDVILLFKLINGTLEEPLEFDIRLLVSYLVPVRFYLGGLFRMINYNTMRLRTDPDSKYRKQYPGSVIWNRRSTVLWGITLLNYNAIQIIDGSGNRIEPAYSAWVRYQQAGIAGKNPNWNYFDYLA